MNQSRERRVLELFDQAMDLPPEQITTLLRNSCGNDPQLCADVEALLATMKDAEDLLPDSVGSSNSTPRFGDGLTVLWHQNGIAARLRAGEFLAGRYVINEAIGKGGMGEVYRATDTRLEREVAIKVLNFANLGHEEMEDRFNREMKSVAALSHSNIVTLHDLAEDGAVSYAVMEFVTGKTLRELIADGLTWQKTLLLAHGVASGLCAAHDHNLMHRDIKPENVIVTEDGHAKILDFGLARPEVPSAQQNLTATEALVPGTVPYMSPEQAEGAKLTCATDIFSFGIVLYEMLTGTNPFRGRSILDTMRRVVDARAPGLDEFKMDIPRDFDELVCEMLCRDVAGRPSAEDLSSRLHRMLLDLEVGSAFANEEAISFVAKRIETSPSAGTSSARRTRSVHSDVSEHASLAVLPFEVFGADDELTAIADGLVENLTTILTRVPLLSLASRSSCFAMKGKPVTASHVRNSLGVRYMLEGSLQEIAGIVRANVQLIDTVCDFHVWAQQFDCPRNTNALPTLLQNILPRLETQLVRAISRDVKAGGSELSGRQLLLEAIAILSLKGWHATSFNEASNLLRQSITLDPDFALSHAYLALVLGIGIRIGLLGDADNLVPEAIAEASLAMELDDMDSNVLGIAGCALSDVGQISRAIPILRNAIELNPNNAQAIAAIGTAYFMEGRLDEAILNLSLGIKISPADSRLAVWYSALSMAYLRSGDLENALTAAESGCRANERTYLPRVVLTAVHLMRNETKQAEHALEESYRVKPDLSRLEITSLVGREFCIAIRRLRSQSSKGKVPGPK